MNDYSPDDLLQQSVFSRRVEVILLPRVYLASVTTRYLRETCFSFLPSPVVRIISFEEHCLVLAYIDRSQTVVDPEGDGCEIVAGFAPHSPSLAVRLGDAKVSIEPDLNGVYPLYRIRDQAGKWLVSTRADILAAILGRGLDTGALFEQLRVGHMVGTSSLFADVERFAPGESVVLNGAECVIESRSEMLAYANDFSYAPATHEWAKDVAKTVGTIATMDGAIAHLTGGIDSRLVLALALSNGSKPSLVVTLGNPGDEDVEIARKIARHYALEHAVIPLESPCSEIEFLEHSRQAVIEGGFDNINAATHGMLRRAAADRYDRLGSSIEIGGAGGECGFGFYYTLADPVLLQPPFLSTWIRLRVLRSGLRSNSVFGQKSSRLLEEKLIFKVRSILSEYSGSLRRASDVFYLRQRMRNWLGNPIYGGAIHAFRAEPLLHNSYLRWAAGLSTRSRSSRRPIMNAIHSLDHWLGDLPFSGDRQRKRGRWEILAHARRRAMTLERKARTVLIRGRSAVRERHSIAGAELLVQCDEVRDSLRGLCDGTNLGISYEAIEGMLQNPKEYEQELGVLISAGWALQRLLKLSKDLGAIAS